MNKTIDRISDVKHYYPNARWYIKRYDDHGKYYQNYGCYSGGNSEIERRSIILRPLEDLTMDECRDLAELRSDLFLHITDGRVWRGNIKFEFQYASSNRRREHHFSLDQLNGEQVHYLLSRNFDIFNLINSKLALDLTKLKL